MSRIALRIAGPLIALLVLLAAAPAVGAQGSAARPASEGGVRELWERFPLEERAGESPSGATRPSDSAQIRYVRQDEGGGASGGGDGIGIGGTVAVVLLALAAVVLSFLVLGRRPARLGVGVGARRAP